MSRTVTLHRALKAAFFPARIERLDWNVEQRDIKPNKLSDYLVPLNYTGAFTNINEDNHFPPEAKTTWDSLPVWSVSVVVPTSPNSSHCHPLLSDHISQRSKSLNEVQSNRQAVESCKLVLPEVSAERVQSSLECAT